MLSDTSVTAINLCRCCHPRSADVISRTLLRMTEHVKCTKVLYKERVAVRP